MEDYTDVGELGTTDYTRISDVNITGQTRADIEHLIVQAKTYSEEEMERRRRKRLERIFNMAINGEISVINDAERVRNDWNDAISGGESLMLGSETYETYVRERKGMDQFDLERANLSEIGFNDKGGFEDFDEPEPDEFHAERAAKLDRYEDDIRISEELRSADRGRERRRDLDRRVIKDIQARDIERRAMLRAGRTTSTADDRFAGRLPKKLRNEVINDSNITFDDEYKSIDAEMDSIGGIDLDL